MPNPNELERQRQEEQMRKMSGNLGREPLNEDVFARDMLRAQIEEQEQIARSRQEKADETMQHVERCLADAATAKERADSLRRTLEKLESPDA